MFSCDVGLSKPDPRIYEIACERLGVEPGDCLFVGDGANDELPGAERAGMAAIQLRAPGEALTPDGEAWMGRSVEHLSDLLELPLAGVQSEAREQFEELGRRVRRRCPRR